jgi:hypothetical protein
VIDHARRFPPPWSVEESEACFVVKDTSGQKLAYVYFEDEPGRRSVAKQQNEVRRIKRFLS